MQAAASGWCCMGAVQQKLYWQSLAAAARLAIPMQLQLSATAAAGLATPVLLLLARASGNHLWLPPARCLHAWAVKAGAAWYAMQLARAPARCMRRLQSCAELVPPQLHVACHGI